MRDMIKPSVALLIICFIVVFSVSIVSVNTKDIIEIRMKEKTLANVKLAFDEGLSFKDITKESIKVMGTEATSVKTVYAGYKDEKLYGVVFETVSDGYGGDMTFIIGVHKNGEISNVILGENSETPGLGTKVREKSFVGKYIGKNLLVNQFEIVRHVATNEAEIEAISGATISSKGMNNAVNTVGRLARKILESGGFLNYE